MEISLDDFDQWSRTWNQPGPDETRRQLLDFLRDWRSREGDWFGGVAEQYYSLIEPEVVDLGENGEFLSTVQKLHLANHTIWHFEGEARRETAPPEWIVEIKRGIDAVNQKRNDQMEKIDEFVLKETAVDPEAESIPLHSEPPGLMLDRLSILSLKLYHYSLKEDRAETVKLLEKQRSDLFTAYQKFLEKLRQDETRFRIYRQFKTYNDPETNPVLAAEADDA